MTWPRRGSARSWARAMSEPGDGAAGPALETVSFAEAEADFAGLLDRVADLGRPVAIVGDTARVVVLVPRMLWDSGDRARAAGPGVDPQAPCGG